MYFTCMTHVRQCEHNYDLISAMIRGYDTLHFHLQWTLHLIMLWSGEGANVHFTCIFGEYAYSWFLSNISYQCDAIFFPGYRNQLQAIIALFMTLPCSEYRSHEEYFYRHTNVKYILQLFTRSLEYIPVQVCSLSFGMMCIENKAVSE